MSERIQAVQNHQTMGEQVLQSMKLPCKGCGGFVDRGRWHSQCLDETVKRQEKKPIKSTHDDKMRRQYS